VCISAYFKDIFLLPRYMTEAMMFSISHFGLHKLMLNVYRNSINDERPSRLRKPISVRHKKVSKYWIQAFLTDPKY
jgi:hypothetical protein